MYVVLRRYEGVASADVDEVMRRVDQGFVPILEQSHGFRAYWAIQAEDGVVASVTVFDDRAGAEESQQRAAAFVQENLAALLPSPPQVTRGEALVARVQPQTATASHAG